MQLASLLWAFLNIIRRNRRLFLFVKSLRSIKKYGIPKTAKEIAAGMRGQWTPLKTYVLLAKNEKIAQASTVFPQRAKISIITSLCNTPDDFLREMIESVTAQTYDNWELCLADGSGENHENVKKFCEAYTQNDERIKYSKTDSGSGISENLNKAIEMASGEYIGLLDEGDMLHPSALYEAMKEICDEGADFIYTDEANFSPNHNVTLRHHKPDFAIDTLCSCNYIGRFVVFSRALMEKAGTFRSKFDGSQDYDLIFRYTDKASKICHIPKILYFHRNGNGEKTSAADITKNMESISAAEKTISAYLKEHGKPARVEGKMGLPGYYRAIYELKEKPLVSIIIPNKDNATLLRKCLSSILEKTAYPNYEILIVENNSTEPATFAFYEELKRYTKVRVLNWGEKGFNFSKICNFGAQYAHGQQFIFLNNDVLIISAHWI